MALTLLDLKKCAFNALGGEPSVIVTSADATKRQLVNEAGRFFAMAHPWDFLIRPVTSLNFTASQAYVTLPTDLGAVISVVSDDSIIGGFSLTTFDDLQRKREQVAPVPGAYWGAVSYPGQTSASAAPGVMRLELWPTPSANATAALKLWYRAGWTELSSDTDVPNVPTWAETLLVQMVRALARGREEDTEEDLLAKVLAGPFFQMARDQDARTQADMGPMQGLAINEALYRTSDVTPYALPNP